MATGPLTSSALGDAIAKETSAEALAFFDAIAPIVYTESIDMDKAWKQSRYDKGDTEEERTAYINCPMNKDQYEAFIDALLAADKTEFHEGETAGYFDGCLPIGSVAERGRETLRFGPMKPVGLTNPHSDEKPYAVVQLRRDNALGTLYNIVVPNQNEIRRPDRGISQNPRVRRGKLCPFRRHSPQYIHQFTHASG